MLHGRGLPEPDTSLGHDPELCLRRQPQTNGVVERFFRTLKEQVVHGRVFETLEDLRDAVRAFIARYNAQWLIEKNGHLSPHARRRQHELAAMPMAA
ncbi:integrase core domain-containing protein [Elioraea tepida]|uniref:Integrase core domain-containing protein n=1 Tax=Elioraea tepida TaxID=2843330 RepID=A0A975YLA3_9PROT|nr:integrase core domain-containing protein [Elioraea tepida]QXM26332.1 integrase core domain-containing protein [Elioraea tepida]